MVLPEKTTSGCKGSPGTNTLAYLDHLKIQAMKSLITLASDKNFTHFYFHDLQMFIISKSFVHSRTFLPRSASKAGAYVISGTPL